MNVENPYLDPVLARWENQPEALFGAFYEDEEWNEVTHFEFRRRALQFSQLFERSGTSLGDVVLIILEHGVDAHAAFIGAMLLGAIPGYMPHPNTKQEGARYWRQHRDVFRHAQPRVILAYDALVEAIAEAAEGSGASVVALSAVEGLPAAHTIRPPVGGATALLQHSSGTTGLKKGVMLTYEQIAAQLEAYRKALQLDALAQMRVASWLPLYHDMGLISSFLLPLWHGAPILSIDPFDWTREPFLLFEAVERYRATHVWVPNFALRHQAQNLRGSRRYDLGSLRAVIGCSEPNKPEAFDLFQRKFADWGVGPTTLQSCYAMAETVFAVTQSRVDRPLRRLTVDRDALQQRGVVSDAVAGRQAMTLLSNGPPAPGCDIRILTEGAYREERVVGEVCVRAPFLFKGYHNDPEATQKAFIDDMLRTGDLGFLDGGEVFIVGRLKDIIIVNGKNIAAHDVEAAVSLVSEIKPGRAVAFGHYLETVGSEQLIVVAERLTTEGDGAAIVRAINNVVALEVGVPCSDVRVVDPGWLVKTTSGKISRSDNLKKYLEHFAS